MTVLSRSAAVPRRYNVAAHSVLRSGARATILEVTHG